MSSDQRRVSDEQQQAALTLVAEWLGRWLGHEGPAPTGREAADHAAGPVLVPEWDFPEEPTPSIVLEGPGNWAYEVAMDPQMVAKFAAIGVHAEAWASFGLCLYPGDEPSEYASMSDADVLREVGMVEAADIVDEHLGGNF